jgi:hypothetical protein
MNYIQKLLHYVEQRDFICDKLMCTDILNLESPKINQMFNLALFDDYQVKQFTFEGDLITGFDGTSYINNTGGCYLWTGYNRHLFINNDREYDKTTNDLTVLSEDAYVIDEITPVVHIDSTGNTKLLSASLSDLLRFIGTYRFEDLYNDVVLTDYDVSHNMILNLLNLKPISYSEFINKRNMIKNTFNPPYINSKFAMK